MATQTFNEWDTIPKRIDGKRPARKKTRRDADFDFFDDTKIGQALTVVILAVSVFSWVYFFQILSVFID